MNFERKENTIRFTNTDQISHDIWHKILLRFNHLGYAFPDEDSVKDYFDRHNWLNEDQSLDVLKVLKLEHNKELYPIEQINAHNQKAIEIFGKTSRWSLTGYILTDGTMLKMSYTGHMRDIDHREINDVLHTEDDSYSAALIQFVNYGNIRVTSRCLEMAYLPTPKQWTAIASFIREIKTSNDICMSIDIANNQGTVVKSFSYDFPTFSNVRNDIETYFKALE